MEFVRQAFDQFPVGFAIWRLSDMVIVYANDHILNIFGAQQDMVGSTTLWDIIGPLDTALILAEVARSNPSSSVNVQVPYEAFTTFKRQDTGEAFSGWYRGKDIVDHDGVIRHRAAVVFAGYDTEEENAHFKEYVKIKAKEYERTLASKVAHELNNALALLTTEIASISDSCGVDLLRYLGSSFSRLAKLGQEMRERAHTNSSLYSLNTASGFANLDVEKLASSIDSISGLRIMIVDDEQEFASGLSTIFEIKRNLTKVAHTSAEALSKAKLFKPHAALIDLHLGDENGRDLGRKLREEFPDINIVYMTGYSSLMHQISAKNDDVVLKKPFEIATALSVLKEGKTNADNS